MAGVSEELSRLADLLQTSVSFFKTDRYGISRTMKERLLIPDKT
ncbi:MAG: hypothetical protein SFH39_05075 [Candidatus Magnetobacterium sp. LHC-1]|nr:hypothetical protein [Candidatus Magnetobacterium casensis]